MEANEERNILWEEKNSTELLMNSESNQITDPSDITNEIKTNVIEKRCCDIGNEKPKWSKLCPKCGKEQIYSHKTSLTAAIKNNWICKSCHMKTHIKYPNIVVLERNCPKCGNIQKYKSKYSLKTAINTNKLCRSCAVRNIKPKEKIIKKILNIIKTVLIVVKSNVIKANIY
jgi:predicted RNA-binding Zn-ribbon protein involved in translation (DUF1610 family)